MDRATRAKEIIAKVTYVTIATASMGAQPWNTPVLAAFDKRYNLYWTSLIDTQHSVNIRENPRVYVSIYDPAVADRDGVHMQASAEELSDIDDIRSAAVLLYESKGKKPREPEEFLNDSLRRMYKATPERFWISLDADAKVDPATAKKEISLL